MVVWCLFSSLTLLFSSHRFFHSFSFVSLLSHFLHTLHPFTLFPFKHSYLHSQLMDLWLQERKKEKYENWTSVKRNSVHNDGWTVLTLIYLFIHSFIFLFVCMFVFTTILNSDEEEEPLLSHPLSFPSLRRKWEIILLSIFFSLLFHLLKLSIWSPFLSCIAFILYYFSLYSSSFLFFFLVINYYSLVF